MLVDYQICVRCVMDTSDSTIHFDVQGVCNHCHRYDLFVDRHVVTGKNGHHRLEKTIERIKRDGRGKPYDCVIGVSGGVDSTMVAYKVKEYGLRPLAVHLDNGWNTELAVSNIYKMLNILDIDLHTHVINWEEFRDLQVAFLKASTPDSEIPTDHAIVSLMYEMADKVGVKYVISGGNIRTEMHIPKAWSSGHFDWKYIKSVHTKFGKVRLHTYPHRTWWQEEYYRQKQIWVYLLNYIDYVKKDAIPFLEQQLGWRDYGGKHYESIYTRFYQGYILPVKFAYDKRRGHLSSLICSGEMSREEALQILERPPYPPSLQKEDREYVVKKLGLTQEEFEMIMKMPPKTIYDYPSYTRDDTNLFLYAIRRVLALPRFLTELLAK